MTNTPTNAGTAAELAQRDLDAPIKLPRLESADLIERSKRFGMDCYGKGWTFYDTCMGAEEAGLNVQAAKAEYLAWGKPSQKFGPKFGGKTLT